MTDILLRVEGPVYQAALGQYFTVHDGSKGLDALPPEILAKIRVVVTNGTVGLTAAEMDLLPNLGLISTVGTGYEKVQIHEAFARDIDVTHAAGTNAVAVAEHTIGMIIGLMRKLARYDETTRAGQWRGAMGPTPMVSGKRIGIFGMGGVGRRVAQLAEAFGMPVSYCSRTAKDTPNWAFVSDLETLAAQVDVLVLTVPGGPETHHAVNEAVLAALGPDGYVVNVGRGSVVKTEALIEALHSGRIAGAALDVFEDEPHIPEELRRSPDVLLSPHVAGLALEVQELSAALLKRNIDAFTAKAPLVSPVPEMAQRTTG